MESIYDAAVKEGFARGFARGEAKGEARGKAEMFLVFARRKFRRVSPKWAEPVRSAAPEQLDDWLLQAYDTDDLESVFNGSAANGDGQAQKEPTGGP